MSSRNTQQRSTRRVYSPQQSQQSSFDQGISPQEMYQRGKSPSQASYKRGHTPQMEAYHQDRDTPQEWYQQGATPQRNSNSRRKSSPHQASYDRDSTTPQGWHQQGSYQASSSKRISSPYQTSYDRDVDQYQQGVNWTSSKTRSSPHQTAYDQEMEWYHQGMKAQKAANSRGQTPTQRGKSADYDYQTSRGQTPTQAKNTDYGYPKIDYHTQQVPRQESNDYTYQQQEVNAQQGAYQQRPNSRQRRRRSRSPHHVPYKEQVRTEDELPYEPTVPERQTSRRSSANSIQKIPIKDETSMQQQPGTENKVAKRRTANLDTEPLPGVLYEESEDMPLPPPPPMEDIDNPKMDEMVSVMDSYDTNKTALQKQGSKSPDYPQIDEMVSVMDSYSTNKPALHKRVSKSHETSSPITTSPGLDSTDSPPPIPEKKSLRRGSQQDSLESKEAMNGIPKAPKRSTSRQSQDSKPGHQTPTKHHRSSQQTPTKQDTSVYEKKSRTDRQERSLVQSSSKPESSTQQVLTNPSKDVQKPVIAKPSTPKAKPVVAANTKKGRKVYPYFKGRRAWFLGLVQLFVAMLCPVFNGAAIYCCDQTNDIFRQAYGCWCPIVFIVFGGMAIGAKKNNRQLFIKVLFVSSFVCMGFALLQFAAFAAAIEMIDDDMFDTKADMSIALSVMLMFFAVIEMADAIWVSVLCGDNICTCDRRRNHESASGFTDYNHDDATFSDA